MDKFVVRLGEKVEKPKLTTEAEADIKSVLLKKFKHQDFRSPIQEDAVRAISERESGKDYYVCLPTGAGKSLCYQLPTLAHTYGVTIVVSPLLALINDQIEHLAKLDIRAETLNSSLTEKKRKEVITDLDGMHNKVPIKFLYVCPETLKTDKFQQAITPLIREKSILYVAVDEAHCVSQMGHDFRKDYLLVGDFIQKIRKSIPDLATISLSATVTKQVKIDIEQFLKLRKGYKQFVASTYRENIFYDVFILGTGSSGNGRGKARIDLTKFIKTSLKSEKLVEEMSGVGIIYCRTRQECEDLADDLTSDLKQPVMAYHSGLSQGKKSQIANDWNDEKVKVIIATMAFGMGIDKKNVRFVVHWNVAKSLTAYYQESGRAGRDGKDSFARLYSALNTN